MRDPGAIFVELVGVPVIECRDHEQQCDQEPDAGDDSGIEEPHVRPPRRRRVGVLGRGIHALTQAPWEGHLFLLGDEPKRALSITQNRAASEPQ